MPGTWVVLVEAEGDPANGVIDRGAVERLLHALGSDTRAGALHSADRYALQVTTTGPSPVEALYGVLSRLANAVRLLELPAWEVVRTEVLTPEELERDFQDHGHDAHPVGRPPSNDDDAAGHELVRRAFSDPLTGLLSREALEHRVERSLAKSSASVAVVCVDLDGFHNVNDHFGDATGDHVLVRVAQRLASGLRPGDNLARLGDDEFAVLLDDSTESAAVAVADRLLDAVRRPLSIEGHELALSASAGIASGHPGESAREVVDNADAALSVAREGGGRGGHVLFGPATSSPAQARPDLHTDTLRDRLAHVVLMQEAAVAANEAATLEEAAEVVLRQVCAHTGCVIGHLWVSPTGTQGPVPATLWHMADRSERSEFREATDKLSFNLGLPGRVWASGRTVWISDVAADPDLLRRKQCAAAGLTSAFAFPVLVGQEVAAVLEFFSRTRMEPFGSFLDVVSSIGTQLGRVVERQRAQAAVYRSEQRLRESGARLAQAQRLARLGSWEHELSTGRVRCSEEMCRMWGLGIDDQLSFD